MTIRIIRDIKAGYGYRTDVRLMMFYVEEGGKEKLLVALMPFGCSAQDESDFEVSVESHIARCTRNCKSCQFSRVLEPMGFEELESRHGISFPGEIKLPPLTATEIWSRVKFPPPASVQELLDQP